jgi:basic amino acid/polyamine antiporter, APA family
MNFKKYFKCRSVEGLIEEASKSRALSRTLGAFQLLMLGIGAIIGAGIFVFTGEAAALHAGPAVTLSFALAGIACACAALCYAEMASTIPSAGSAYTYAYATLGELPAWIIAGMIILTYILGASAVASGWSSYVQSFLADYNMHVPYILSGTLGKEVITATGEQFYSVIDLPAALIVLLLTTIVYRGAETSAAVNSVIVFIKMTVIFGFIVLGATKINPDNWIPFIPENTGKFGEFGYSGIVAGAAFVLLAYTGFDAVATAAQETKNPKRDLPIGIIGSLIICTVVYILVSCVLTGVVNYSELNVSSPMAIAVNAMNIPWLSTAIKIGAVAGLTSVILVLIYGSVRIMYTVTHDGLLPKRLAKTNKKYHTPHILTWVIGGSIIVMSSVVPAGELLKLSNFGTVVTFVIVCLGTLYLRYKKPNIKREFRCPFVPFVPVVGVVLFIAIIAGLPWKTFVYAGGWITFVIIMYFVYGRHNSHLLHPHKKN